MSQLNRAYKYIFYGPSKIGISQFLYQWPNSTTLYLDVSQTCLIDKKMIWINTYEGLLEKINAIHEKVISGEAKSDTLIIDNIDKLEDLICMHTMGTLKIESPIDNVPYSNGIHIATATLNNLLDALNRLNLRCINIVLAGHATINTMQLPTGEVYNTFDLLTRLLPHKGHSGATILNMWTDSLCFVHQEDFINGEFVADRGNNKDYAPRIYTDRRPLFNAGARFIMPFSLELNWRNETTRNSILQNIEES